MAEGQVEAQAAKIGVMIASSLPRVFTTQIQCAFGTYFWEMYTFEFGWSPAEYGTVSSIYNGTQFISYIILGFLLYVLHMANADIVRAVFIIIEIVMAIIHAAKSRYRRGLYNMLGVTCSTTGATCPKGTIPKPKTAPKTIASSFPSTLLNQPPKPGPVRAWKRFMGTRAFCVYFLVVIHGIAMSGYELCTQAIPAQNIDGSNVGKTFTVNMMFFTVANLVVIWIFSFVRYYVHGRARLAEKFIVISVLYNIFQLPLLALFGIGVGIAGKDAGGNIIQITRLNPGDESDANVKVRGGKEHVTFTLKTTGTGKPIEVDYDANAAPTEGGTGNPTQWVQLGSYTVFHATVYFWIFTGGPLTFYVSTNLLDGNEKIMAFGVPFILIGFAGAMVIPGLLTLIGANILDNSRYPDTIGQTSSGSAVTGTERTQVTKATVKHSAIGIKARRLLFFITILGQSITLLFFYTPNTGDLDLDELYSITILILTGVVNTLFLSYTYACMGMYTSNKGWKMLCYGGFYAIMGLVVSQSMAIMFKSFNVDEIRRFCGFNYHYCFPFVYKAITIIFILFNLVAFVAGLAVSCNGFNNSVGLTFNSGGKKPAEDNSTTTKLDVNLMDLLF